MNFSLLLLAPALFLIFQLLLRLDISIGKHSPLRGMFPSIIPSRLGKLRASPVDRLDGRDIADAVLVRGNAHNRTVLLMEADVLVLKSTVA